MTQSTADGITEAIVFAAGRGTRMATDCPKVLLPLNGQPMIEHVLRELAGAGFGSPALNPIVVIGFDGERVRAVVGNRGRFVVQPAPAGTGDAARVALSHLRPETRRIMIIHGDEPLITADLYREMLRVQVDSGAPIVLLTGQVDDTHGLGRVIRDETGRVRNLVQDAELTPAQRASKEINFGAYVFERDFLELSLSDLPTHAGGEEYLTDVVRTAATANLRIVTVSVPDAADRMGVNDPTQLRRADAYLRAVAS